MAVALLAEGVDRNSTMVAPPEGGIHVALLAEGVDRNDRPGGFVDIIIPRRPPRGGRG